MMMDGEEGERWRFTVSRSGPDCLSSPFLFSIFLLSLILSPFFLSSLSRKKIYTRRFAPLQVERVLSFIFSVRALHSRLISIGKNQAPLKFVSLSLVTASFYRSNMRREGKEYKSFISFKFPAVFF